MQLFRSYLGAVLGIDRDSRGVLSMVSLPTKAVPQLLCRCSVLSVDIEPYLDK